MRKKDEYSGLALINEIYRRSFDIDLKFDEFDITKLIINTNLSSMDTKTLYLNKSNSSVDNNALLPIRNTFSKKMKNGLNKKLSFHIKTGKDAIKASQMMKCNSIITGGHLDGINTIYIDGEITSIKQELIETDNLHGTGCNLSAAITAFLAKNNDLHTSILKALDYVYEGIKNGNYGTLIAKI